MNKKIIETRLEAFLTLKDTGLKSHYINSNIEFYKKLKDVNFEENGLEREYWERYK